VIDAGTIHAIGAGVTLIEPQKIAPKKSGKTYRLWDWNRKYDDRGQKDPHGKPRELHIEDSFQVIDFGGLRGKDFISHIQPERRIVGQYGRSVETVLAETENFGVSQLELMDHQPLTDDCSSGFHGFIPYAGYLEIHQHGQQLASVSCGQSVVLPSNLGEYTLLGEDAHVLKVYYPKHYL
jgi:mannose-6-phosphate isomerase class I